MRRQDLSNILVGLYIKIQIFGGGWYTKVNLKIDIFMNLTKHYWVFSVLGTFIGTENDAKNKPKNFHRFYILAEEAVNKERNSFMQSTDYCYEEKPSRVRRERESAGGDGLSNLLM